MQSDSSDKPNKKVAVYIRLTADKQLLDSQNLLIQEWLKKSKTKDSQVIYFLDDGVDSTEPDYIRPGLSNLLESLELGQIETLATFEFSRLSNEYQDFLSIMNLCKKKNISVEVPMEGNLNFNTSQNNIINIVKSFLKEEEHKKLSKRTRIGLEKARQKGVKLGRPSGHHSNRGHRKQYPSNMIDEINKMTLAGLSSKEIAHRLRKKFKISQSTVFRIQKRFNIKGKKLEKG